MAETPPLTESIQTQADQEKAYDPVKSESLAKWVVGLTEYAADARKNRTNEDRWDKWWHFMRGQQWEGPMPSYRRPIVVNIWRRAYHILLATITGHRPTLKLVPSGTLDPNALKTWQDALWAAIRADDVMRKYAEAWSWGAVCDGGWLKVGYGKRAEWVDGELPDVLVAAPHPKKIFPDPDCTDVTLAECGFIAYREPMDLATITAKYPEHGWRVKPDDEVSLKWPDKPPDWANQTHSGVAPAGGWNVTGDYRRARATMIELFLDDPSVEQIETKVPVFDPITKVKTDERREYKWVKKYPHGRVITGSKDTVVRDIPNPYGKAFGWRHRWPYVFVAGAMEPGVLWRAGLLSGLEENQRVINKTASLLVENAIKVTNAMVIADENAMDDEDWDLLSLVPGVKIRKRQATDIKVVFPEALPAHAFNLPDYMIRKLEESVGLHDPPISPGQAVAAKTVAFLQQKGSFLLGVLAMLGDQALEQLGTRMVGLMQDRYLPGRPIPFFENEQLAGFAKLPEIPASLRMRVEATSAFQELMATAGAMANAEAQSRKRTR